MVYNIGRMAIIIFIRRWVSWKAVSGMAKRMTCRSNSTKNNLHLSASSDQYFFSKETAKNQLMSMDRHNSSTTIKKNSLKCSSRTQYLKCTPEAWIIKEGEIEAPPPSYENGGQSTRQDHQMKQLETLRKECLRIDRLRSELVRKSRRMQEQQGRKNQVHGHQSFFASTHKLQSPSATPRR